jgi:hypothetical protein
MEGRYGSVSTTAEPKVVDDEEGKLAPIASMLTRFKPAYIRKNHTSKRKRWTGQPG